MSHNWTHKTLIRDTRSRRIHERDLTRRRCRFPTYQIPAVCTCSPITDNQNRLAAPISPTHLLDGSFAPSSCARRPRARRTPATQLAARMNNSRLEGNLWVSGDCVFMYTTVKAATYSFARVFPVLYLISRRARIQMKRHTRLTWYLREVESRQCKWNDTKFKCL